MVTKKIVIFGTLFFVVGSLYAIKVIFFTKPEPIRIGILHSLTGYMATGERPAVDAAMLAIEEINAAGGIIGRKVEPIIADGASDRTIFMQQAEMLITEKKVHAIIGTQSSASRKAVKEVAERYNNLFICPSQYEGVEVSDNTIYTGATANQQILPAIMWCSKNIGKRFFIIGSEEIYSAIGGIIIEELLKSIHCELVGQIYLQLGSKDVAGAIEAIQKTKPDVILNMMYSDTNIYFFKALRAAGITPDKIPTMSFSIAEPDIQEIGPSLMVGDYASWSYFQSVQSNENKDFVKAFKKRYGENRVIYDMMEAAYFSIYLWKEGIEFAGTPDPARVFLFIQNQNLVAPEGNINIDGYNHNTWKMCRIGKVNTDGQFDIVWSSKKTVYPLIYLFKSPQEWDQILKEIYNKWGGRWARD